MDMNSPQRDPFKKHDEDNELLLVMFSWLSFVKLFNKIQNLSSSAWRDLTRDFQFMNAVQKAAWSTSAQEN